MPLGKRVGEGRHKYVIESIISWSDKELLARNLSIYLGVDVVEVLVFCFEHALSSCRFFPQIATFHLRRAELDGALAAASLNLLMLFVLQQTVSLSWVKSLNRISQLTGVDRLIL